jgi:GAF domain-containing protein
MKEFLERWMQRFRTRGPQTDGRADLRDELVALASDLVVETDYESLMTRMCDRIRRLVGCDRCSIFILEDGAYRGRFNVGNPPDLDRFFADLRLPPEHPLIHRAVRTRRQVTVNDAQNDPLTNAEATKKARIRSIVLAPLMNDNEGALGFISAEFNETGRAFRPEESELFGGLANIVALAIERHESRRERDLIRSEMEATSSLTALGRFAGSSSPTSRSCFAPPKPRRSSPSDSSTFRSVD